MFKCWVLVAIARPLQELFYYVCEQHVVVGARVQVPFGTQDLIGVVAAIHTRQPDVDYQLKSVLKVLDKKPVIEPPLWRLIFFASRYYQHPIGEVVQAALPKILRIGGKNERTLMTFYALTALGLAQLEEQNKHKSKSILGKKQYAVLASLQSGELSYRQLKAHFALTPAWLNDLVDRQWLAKKERFSVPICPKSEALILNEAQQMAFRQLKEQTGFRVSVLEGVTGSGKTEVYIRWIEQLCADDGQVLLLVPEIGLVKTMLERLRKRLKQIVVEHHSGLTDKQRLENWQAITTGDAQVLVGTRSAVFYNFNALQGIIVDEEHDPAYKQQDGFRYHGRDLAIVRAQQTDIPIILGSATLSLETYHHIHSKHWQHLKMCYRVNEQALPKVTIENIENSQMQEGLSVGLIKAMRRSLAKNEQVMLFLNRRGFAPILLCEQCGWQSDCEACDTLMTAHTVSRRLICHHCGRQQPLPESCPSCQQKTLLMYGMGTQRLEQSVVKQFPHAKVMRIDSDAFTTPLQFEQALTAVRGKEVDIILGTQWLSKGHHFPNLNLVAVIDADQALYSLDFRSEERLAQILVQVSGRAGRESQGQVWVQTRQPNHPVFKYLTEPYDNQLARLYQQRQESLLPPCSAQVLLFAKHQDIERATAALLLCKEGAQAAGIGLDWLWLGPVPAIIARKDGQHRVHLLIQASEKKHLQAQLPELNRWLIAQSKMLRVRTGIDVDPLWLE